MMYIQNTSTNCSFVYELYALSAHIDTKFCQRFNYFQNSTLTKNGFTSCVVVSGVSIDGGGGKRVD